MTKPTARVAGTGTDRRRKPRSRVVPKWLKTGSELDAIARSRCLMLLSVLSGETPVTEAIVQAQMSRATYYKLESVAVDVLVARTGLAASGVAAELVRLELERRVAALPGGLWQRISRT